MVLNEILHQSMVVADEVHEGLVDLLLFLENFIWFDIFCILAIKRDRRENYLFVNIFKVLLKLSLNLSLSLDSSLQIGNVLFLLSNLLQKDHISSSYAYRVDRVDSVVHLSIDRLIFIKVSLNVQIQLL